MNTQDGIALTGKLIISLNDEIVQEADNLVVTAGKAWVAQRMEGVTLGVMTHMGIGTSSTAAAAGQTDLVAVTGARLALTDSGGIVAGSVITFA